MHEAFGKKRKKPKRRIASCGRAVGSVVREFSKKEAAVILFSG